MKKRFITKLLTGMTTVAISASSFAVPMTAVAAPEESDDYGFIVEEDELEDVLDEKFEDEAVDEYEEEMDSDAIEDDMDADIELEEGEDPELLGLYVGKTSVDLMIGQWSHITVHGTNNGKFYVNDDFNSSVASVSLVGWNNNGSTVSIHAVAAGTTSVTITDEAGETQVINIKVHDRVYVNGVALSQYELKMNIDDAATTITAIPQPANADVRTVTWTTSDDTVATVSPVTGSNTLRASISPQGAGTATIKAITDDGHYEASCTVTVNGDRVDISEIKMVKSTIYLHTYESNCPAPAVIINPENATHRDLKWTTSNKNIAEINETTGVIKTHWEGEVIITATSPDGKVSGSCKVIVTSKLVEVSDLSLNKTEALMKQGATLGLTATVMPENATDNIADWSSSDTSVATVDKDGVVTAIKAGTAVITALAGDKTATCEITVQNPVSKIELEKSEVALNVGDTYKAVATVTPKDTTNKELEWQSSNTSVATVSEDGTIKAVAPGKAVISVSSTNDSYFGNVFTSMIVEVKAKEIAEEDKKAVEKAEKAIEQIPAEITPEDKDAVIQAKTIFDQLTDDQKELLDKESVKKLEEAVNKLSELIGNLDQIGTLIYNEETGVWDYVKGGKVDYDTYAFINYNGYKFIVANGCVAPVNGLVMDPNSDLWYFCAEGQVVKHTGLVMYNEEWFYVNEGVLDTGLNALVGYNGGLFYVAAGRITREVSGLVLDPNSPSWYFVALGEVQNQYTGLAAYNGEWFYVEKGRLADNFTGTAEYDGQVFNVVNGMVRF